MHSKQSSRQSSKKLSWSERIQFVFLLAVAIVGLLIGLVSVFSPAFDFFVNLFPFLKLINLIALLLVIFSILGIAISLERYEAFGAAREESHSRHEEVLQAINQLQDKIRKLSEIVDLSQDCNVQSVGEILHLYLNIRETEFRQLKDQIIHLCITQLNGLAHEKVLAVSGIEYHSWLIKMMQLCSQDELVLAFRHLSDWSWFEQHAEKEYINENVKAAHRGVKIERIFVSSKERLLERRNREVIHQLMNGGVATYIVWSEEVTIQNFVPMQEISGGFVLFGNRVAITNKNLPPNKLEGIVTMNPEQLKHYQRWFEQLKFHARLANTEFFSELDSKTVP